MNDGPIVRRISFDIHGEFITQLAREWFYTGEKSHEKVIEILMDSMTGTDTPEAQIRRYAEDILLGRAALKGSTAAGTYHLETYEPGEEEQMPQSMNIWKEVERRKKAEKDLRRMIERWDVAMDHLWMVRAGRNFSWSGMGSASGMGAELHERKIPGGSNERRH